MNFECWKAVSDEDKLGVLKSIKASRVHGQLIRLRDGIRPEIFSDIQEYMARNPAASPTLDC